MEMKIKIIGYLLLCISLSEYCLLYVSASCTAAPPTLSYKTTETVIANEYVLYLCTNPMLFTNGESVVPSTCTNDAWTSVTASCSGTAAIVTNCSTATAPTGSTEVTIQNISTFAKVYQCDPMKVWLTGELVRYSQCNASGQWTPIYDICVDDYDMPRDCTDVMTLGIIQSGAYYAVPSGSPLDSAKLVTCDFNVTSNGGGWTVILITPYDPDWTTKAKTRTDFIEGYKSTIYRWAGVQMLSDLSKDRNGTRQGMVLEVRVTYKNVIYIATYSDFSVGDSPDYPLLSLGTYYGNAGDAMCYSLNENFKLYVDPGGHWGYAWWGYSESDATSEVMTKGVPTALAYTKYWTPLSSASADINRIEMRIRQQDFDAELRCPMMTGSDPRWSTTISTIPLDRFPGSNLTWKCTNEYLFEGEEGGQRSTEGTATCLQESGQLPQWSRNVTLPCSMICPAQFVLSNDGLTCYHFSTDQADSFEEAQLRCQELNASLATIRSINDTMLLPNATEEYFVTHNQRQYATLHPAFPSTNVTCAGECTQGSCRVIRNNGTFENYDCHNASNYMCQIAANVSYYCPDWSTQASTYYRLSGGCYGLATASSPVSVYQKCIQDGSDLAYPTTKAQADNMVRLLIQNMSLSLPKKVLIGVNYAKENWTNNGMYTMGDLESELVPDTTYIWQVMNILGIGNYSFMAVNYSDPTVTSGLCHYNGFLDCSFDPPPDNATDGMTIISGSSLNTALDSQIVYKCLTGYFVDGNKTLPTQQTVTCMGQLGGWFPYLKPCIRVPVCDNSTLNMTTVGIDLIVEDNDTYYYNGSMSFICRDGLSSQTGVNQTFTCVENATAPGNFHFFPQSVEPCDVCEGNVSVANATSTWTDSTLYVISANVTVTCIANNQFDFEVTNQTVVCTDQGWNYTYTTGCYLACVNEPSTVGPNMTVNFTENYIGTELSYICDPGMYFETTQTFPNMTDVEYIYCNDSGQWINPRDANSFACYSFCTADPPAVPVNATSSWNGYSRKTNTTVIYSCSDGYLFLDYSANVTVACNGSEWTGYNDTMFECVKICYPPPTVLLNISTTFNYSVALVNDTANYPCQEGFGNPADKSRGFQLYCTEGGWTNPPVSFVCEKICFEDPPAPSPPATSNFSGDTREGTSVGYTCPPALSFEQQTGPNKTVLQTSCINGTWTPYPIPDCICGPPPQIVLNITTSFNESTALVNDTAAYLCEEGYGNYATKQRGFYLTCTETGWTTPIYNQFLCEKMCLENAPAPTSPTTTNFTGNTRDGQVVIYRCPNNMAFEQRTDAILYSKCKNGNWTVYPVPKCLTITTPPPTTVPPIVLPQPDPSLEYDKTTQTHYGTLSDWIPSSGIAGDFTVVNSLFGFDTGIQLNSSKQQCMTKENYAADGNQCEINPAYCTKGLSYSIWAQVLYDASVYDMTGLSASDEQYFLSTGGDKIGHPGITLGIKKQWLFALVSNGTHYWYTEILGQIPNNTWNNVGVRWDNVNGMEVYVNDSKVGSTDIISATPGVMPSFSPPLLMVGCHKTMSDSTYRGYLNGALDEVAMWPERLNLTGNHTLKFLGGYNGDLASISPEEFLKMLDNVDLSNPGQLLVAVKLASSMDGSTTPTDASPTGSSVTGTSSTAASPTAGNITADPAQVKSLQTRAQMLMKLLDNTKVPKSISEEDAILVLGDMTKSFDSLLSPGNKEEWKQIQSSTENLGVMQLVDRFNSYTSKMLQGIKFTNSSQPMCHDILKKEIYIKMCKMRVQDLEAMASRVQLPDYTQKIMQVARALWVEPMPADRSAFSTGIFPDERCNERPVSYTIQFYSTAHELAAKCTNPRYIKQDLNKNLDSRIMSLNVQCDLAVNLNGTVDTSQPICEPDKEILRKLTNVFKALHILPQEARTVNVRKPKLFENITVTTIKERYCVWWNGNLSDFGAWDSGGSEMTETSSEYSKCSYSSFGIYSILATKTDPIEVPDAPFWLTILKYILYGISAFAVILYMAVVIYSGELKDMFHLIGFNLALAILAGSIVMVISEFEDIKVNRTMCTVIGTMLHLFYGAVGMWMFGLGLAAFSGITVGVIGGRLGVYMTICWGLAIAGTGIPYLFMYQDLGYDPRCFIGWENYVKWVFFAPQLLCSFVALFFAIVVLCNLATPALRKENLIQDYGSFCRGAAFLLILLSITWNFGLLAYVRFGFTNPDFYPIFQVLNSISGLCLFLFIGLGSIRFRSVLTRQTLERRNLLKSHAFGLPTTEEQKKTNQLIKPGEDFTTASSTSNLVG